MKQWQSSCKAYGTLPHDPITKSFEVKTVYRRDTSLLSTGNATEHRIQTHGSNNLIFPRTQYIILLTTFLFNNQPDALIIPILFCYKTLHVSGISAHHQEFSTVHSVLVSFMPVSDDRFQAESGRTSCWKRSSETSMKLTIAECTVENSWWWAEKMPETSRVL